MSYTFLNLPYDVLKDVPQPLVYNDIWEKAFEIGLTAKLDSTGKTP